MVRRENLAQSLDSIFRSRIGLEFIEIAPLEQKNIDEYVATFTSNLIYLQTLIDSFNTDDETKNKVRTLASILEFDRVDKISELREEVTHLYKSLQWL